jgi:hypothetical protein
VSFAFGANTIVLATIKVGRVALWAKVVAPFICGEFFPIVFEAARHGKVGGGAKNAGRTEAAAKGQFAFIGVVNVVLATRNCAFYWNRHKAAPLFH